MENKVWKTCHNKCEKYMKIIWNNSEHNVEVPNHINVIFFISFSYLFHIVGPGPQAQAPKRRQRPGPPPFWGPGPDPGPHKCEQHMKITWNKYESHVIWHFHVIFICISCYFHIILTCSPHLRLYILCILRNTLKICLWIPVAFFTILPHVLLFGFGDNGFCLKNVSCGWFRCLEMCSRYPYKTVAYEYKDAANTFPAFRDNTFPASL